MSARNVFLVQSLGNGEFSAAGVSGDGGVCRQINPDKRLLVGSAVDTYKSPTFFNDIPNGLNHGSAKGHRA